MKSHQYNLQGIADDSEKRTYKIQQRTLDIDEDISETPPTIVNTEVEVADKSA